MVVPHESLRSSFSAFSFVSFAWLAGWLGSPLVSETSSTPGLLLAGWHGCSGEPARFTAETLLHLTSPQSSAAPVRSRQSIN